MTDPIRAWHTQRRPVRYSLPQPADDQPAVDVHTLTAGCAPASSRPETTAAVFARMLGNHIRGSYGALRP